MLEAWDENGLTPEQLGELQVLFHEGASNAAEAFSKWTGKHCAIRVEHVEQLLLQEATGALGATGAPICLCAMGITGRLTGQLIFGFDDASGLGLADLLLGLPVGTSSEWGEMETSAALETTNVLGCGFLNSLTDFIPSVPGAPSEIIPSPPTFLRDFPESLVEFALMEQAMISNQVLLARTLFHVDNSPVDWNLLYVPDAESMQTLRSVLESGLPERGPHEHRR